LAILDQNAGDLPKKCLKNRFGFGHNGGNTHFKQSTLCERQALLYMALLGFNYTPQPIFF